VARKLAAMNGEEIRTAVLRGASTSVNAPAPVPVPGAGLGLGRVHPTPTPTSTATAMATPTPSPTPAAAAPAFAPARAAVAVLEAPADPPPSSDLDTRIVSEIRAALRGCTAVGLAAALATPQPPIDAALEALAVRGTVARRGTRWFMS
jgi:hypothetical protein